MLKILENLFYCFKERFLDRETKLNSQMGIFCKISTQAIPITAGIYALSSIN